MLGGVCSDWLLRRGHSLTFARKAPIIAGMLLSVTMIACNYTNTQTLVMFLMSLAFFGKGFGALGWTVIADTSPKELVGVNGGVFNLFGNLSTITTPTVIGFLVAKTGSFNDALVFVGVTALMAIFSYLVIVGEIKRLDLELDGAGGRVSARDARERGGDGEREDAGGEGDAGGPGGGAGHACC